LRHLYGPASRQIILRFAAIYGTQSIFYRFGLGAMGDNETNVVLRILTFSNKLAFVAACNASVREKIERDTESEMQSEFRPFIPRNCRVETSHHIASIVKARKLYYVLFETLVN